MIDKQTNLHPQKVQHNLRLFLSTLGGVQGAGLDESISSITVRDVVDHMTLSPVKKQQCNVRKKRWKHLDKLQTSDKLARSLQFS